MNDESTKTFPAMTTGGIAALAASDNIDDNQLADRLARRIVLEVKRARGVITPPCQGISRRWSK